MASSNSSRSNSNKSVYGQITNFSVTRSGNTVTFSGYLYIDATKATQSTLGSSTTGAFYYPLNFYNSSNQLIASGSFLAPSWGSGYGFYSGRTYNQYFTVSFSDSSGYDGLIICQAGRSDWSFSWTDGYALTITGVNWSAYSSAPSTPSFPNYDDYYESFVSYPSAPTVFKTSGGKTKFAKDTLVKLEWDGANFGDFSSNYYYELFEGNTSIYTGPEKTHKITLKASTEYTIYCKNGNGNYSGVGKKLFLYVPANNSKAIIKKIGTSDSNPGFSKKGSTSFSITWQSSTAGSNNSITKYGLVIDGKEIASNIPKTSTNYTASFTLSANSYKVQIKTYDEVGNSILSENCYLYTVSPSIGDPGNSTSVLEDLTTINWAALKTNSLNNDQLTIKYTLQYAIVKTGALSYNDIATNLTSNSYNWDNSKIGFKNDEVISLKVIGYVYHKTTNALIASVSSQDSNNSRLFKGTLPVNFSTINFSIPVGDYYGASSPMNIDYLVDTKSWIRNNNSIFNFTNSLQINCFFSQNWTESTGRVDCVRVVWHKGSFSGEIIVKTLSIKDGIYYFPVKLTAANAPQLFTNNKDKVSFEIYNLYETKLDGEATGIYVFSKTPSLDFNGDIKIDKNTYYFTRAILPAIYVNGTNGIPLLKNNKSKEVDFYKQTIDGVKLENGISNRDYQLEDLRANTINSNVPVVGFKIYAAKNSDKNSSRYIVNNYLKQTGGEIKFDATNNFFLLSKPLINSGEPSKDSSVTGFVGFYPQILKDDQYLINMFNDYYQKNMTSLKELATEESFCYIITAIDALKQESNESYILNVTYDFRLAAEFQEGLYPNLIDSGFISKTIDNKTGYLFYGQTNSEDGMEYDWITFEWYPAFNKNDYLTYETNYTTINGKQYLLAGKTDPNYYTLFKWTDKGESYSKKLILDEDYQATSVTLNGKEVLKYIGKYAMNLKNINNNEYFNLTLMPSYLDQRDLEKMSNTGKDIYPIQKTNKTTAYFHLSRFTPPLISYKENQREQGVKFSVILMIEDKGFLDNGGIKSSSSTLTLSNSSLPNREISVTLNPIHNLTDLTYNFTDYINQIYDNMPFSTKTDTTITINRYSISGYTISNNQKTSSVNSVFTYYIPANFSTLSLRKNKVGINYSNLTNVEEALYVVAKDRIDSGNDTGNVAVYGKTYPHVFSIQGNKETQMPDFDKNTGIALDTARTASIYMGFYTVNNESLPYRVGSFGMELGYPYFVYKGKYYNDNTTTPVEDNKGNIQQIQKRYNNKDYFEKISIADLPTPTGTVVLFPRAKLITNNVLDQAKLTEISKTWFLCDGQNLDPKVNGQLIKYLYNIETIEPGETYKTPQVSPEGKAGELFCYIIKGDA